MLHPRLHSMYGNISTSPSYQIRLYLFMHACVRADSHSEDTHDEWCRHQKRESAPQSLHAHQRLHCLATLRLLGLQTLLLRGTAASRTPCSGRLNRLTLPDQRLVRSSCTSLNTTIRRALHVMGASCPGLCWDTSLLHGTCFQTTTGSCMHQTLHCSWDAKTPVRSCQHHQAAAKVRAQKLCPEWRHKGPALKGTVELPSSAVANM